MNSTLTPGIHVFRNESYAIQWLLDHGWQWNLAGRLVHPGHWFIVHQNYEAGSTNWAVEIARTDKRTSAQPVRFDHTNSTVK